jgi:sirohydrochlorin cobaltochelatase
VSRNLLERLAAWLDYGPDCRMGEICIRRDATCFELSHWEDEARADLQCSSDPADARRLALYDDAGLYRPLKTAPNLRHGWKLVIRDLAELRVALDFFYPAMLGILCDWESGKVSPICLRETLGRQSGMYAVTRKISDGQADRMIGSFCASTGGCLKTILWHISPEGPITSLPPEKFRVQLPSEAERAIPLLCHEACNLLVARAREVVKGTVAVD